MKQTFRSAGKFVGTAMSKWITTSATSLYGTFRGATEMNANLSGWNVGKVVTLRDTFYGALKFAGTGLGSWITASVTNLDVAFFNTWKMNSDLSGWSVAKVTSMRYTFQQASKFIGTGLSFWDTASVTHMGYSFSAASEMNADLGAWKMNKVTSFDNTFSAASKFVGTGLNLWDTASITSLRYTFNQAGEMNADLSGWTVGKVRWTDFDLSGLDKTFDSTASLSSCNKRRIANAWKTKLSTPSWNAFLANYNGWTSEWCIGGRLTASLRRPPGTGFRACQRIPSRRRPSGETSATGMCATWATSAARFTSTGTKWAGSRPTATLKPRRLSVPPSASGTPPPPPP